MQEKTKRYDVASPKCGHTLAEWLAVRRHYGEKCLRCGATDRTLTRDHVVPLALGGADTIDNIQPLCGPCNCWKGARVIDFCDGWEEGKSVPKDFREAEGEGRWLPVNEAAQALGVSVEALRGRIKRNTVLSDLVGDKRVVWVSEPRPDTDQATDRPRSASDALISEMRDRIESLERQLEAERQANSEHRRLLAAALERIPPQLEAPSEAPETTGSATEETEPHPDTPGAQEGVQRPWWRRMFGGG